MRILVVGLLVVTGASCWGESGCFKSVGEAARRAGVRDEGGYRVEGVRRDVLSGLEWVRVVRCGRPEMPGLLVRGVGQAEAVTALTRADKTKAGLEVEAPVSVPSQSPMVVAGDKVRVVWEEGATRGELAGVALVSGGVGARVRVRVEGFAKSAEERMVQGSVLAAGLVGLEVGR